MFEKSTRSVIFFSTFGFIAFLLFFAILALTATTKSSYSDVRSTSAEITDQKNVSVLASKLSKQEIEILSKLLKTITADEASNKAILPDAEKNFPNHLQTTWGDFSKYIKTNIQAFPTVIDGIAQAVSRILTGANLEVICFFMDFSS